MNLTDEELNLLHRVLYDDLFDDIRHYPNEYTEDEIHAAGSLAGKIENEMRNRK